MRHKHYGCIVAWANGEIIQVHDKPANNWLDLTNAPHWYEFEEYRIKPEPKPDVVRYLLPCPHMGEDQWMQYPVRQRDSTTVSGYHQQIKVTRDGETGALKAAEVIS